MKRNKGITRALPRDIAAELRLAAPGVFAMVTLIFMALRVLTTFR
jgi:hypothetical protein